MPVKTPAREPGRLTVEIDREQFSPGDTVTFTVTVSANTSLKAKALIAELFGVEEIEPEFEDEEDFGEDEEEALEDVETLDGALNGEAEVTLDEDEDDWGEELEEMTSFTHEDEAVLAMNVSLQAGESRTFDGSFTLPENAQPSYFGVRAAHTWWLDAYLEGDVEVSGGKEFLVR